MKLNLMYEVYKNLECYMNRGISYHKANLQILCSSCHATLHRNYEWKKKRDKNKILRDKKGRFKNKNETKTNN